MVFDFHLPKERIAQRPADRRDAARLMVLGRADGSLRHARFSDLPGLIRPGDLVVVNDTRVVPARLRARRSTGGRVEVLLVEQVEPGLWRAMLDTPRRLRDGETLTVGPAELTVLGRGDDGLRRLRAPAGILELGEPPLPPYIRRPGGATAEDRERYQTVFAEAPGSVAAPTAGLHFTPELLARLPVVRLTMHIGPGTFRPIRAASLAEHRMDGERYRIAPDAMERIASARRVVAVGTSVTRALEAEARTGALEGWTDLFIHPPFEFRRVGALVTNFHLPGGTPLALASAFAGVERLRAAYAEALRLDYRFYSYGDAMLID
jgi:S-adenosylmethionine:tRNA ribosyltransferase-isomerase